MSNSDKSTKPLSKWVPRNQKVFLASVSFLSMVHPTVMGYDSMMTGSILNLDSFVSYFHLNNATTGLNNAATWAGELIACFTIVQYLNDKFGRRISVYCGIVVLVIAGILQAAAKNTAMFVVGRFVLGFGAQITNISAIILVAELCPIHLRGFMMGLAFSCFLVGALLSSGITYGVRNAPGNWNWRIPCLVQMGPLIFAVINLLLLPESPKFLFLNGYERETFETLMITHNNDKAETQKVLDEYRLEVEKAKIQEPRPWRMFLKSRINLHKIVISFTQAILTEMAGSSVGTYYLSILLTQAGISSSTERLQVNIVSSAWQLVCACSGCLVFDRIGRKVQALISLTGMVISFFILGGLVKKYGDGDNRSGSFGAIAMMFIFSGFYSFTYTPLTTLYPSELYPYEMRSAGTTLFAIFNGSWGLIASFVLPFAMNGIGWKFYIVNAAYDAVFIPIVYYTWVETRGIDIERVDEIFWQHPINSRHSLKMDSEESDSVESVVVEIINKV
ncbi:hypothetical protein PSN45_002113 [Yamadazyma tenuis]|uniref:Putative xylose transporter n=1 Tax=Candida tenuis (strain ATCC 10573 / BCRC 21748 / CBS 615 / JCM 9827 / NBRC 10315 / NRRL Y-1498 / VKM Y-70) TaxID=590646 RepID=G3BC83_CANTC|nr:putative xylose transporter [Yamadazyma tenuis ATCC 10573]EGV60139.1 putative xylose transporter [Yamadazyma tenuis ATCC 10573]WEJ94622.1 hypothetical protein PSN45_002113 [Yamadazyma tenuis]